MGFSLKWLGHASFQITVSGKNVYIDPYEGVYDERADLVLVTHSHFDHCDYSKIEKILKEDTTVIAPAECISKIKGKVKTLKLGEKATIEEITVEAVQAYNYKRFRSPGVPFHPKSFGVGYLITVDNKTIYHAGDTDFIPEMKQLREKIYLALLPSSGTYTMDNSEAAEATLAVNPEVVIPMHRRDSDPEEFKKKVESESQIKVILLRAGEKHEFE